MVINRGRFVTHVPVAELTSGRHVVVRTPETDRFVELLRAGGGADVVVRDGRVLVTGLAIEEVGALAARRRVVLHELRTGDADLESAFFALTEDLLEEST